MNVHIYSRLERKVELIGQKSVKLTLNGSFELEVCVGFTHSRRA